MALRPCHLTPCGEFCRGPPNWTTFTGYGGHPANGSHPQPQNTTAEPIHWFVDLLADFHISNIILTAGDVNLTNASIYIGSDATSVFGNTLIVVRILSYLPPADCADAFCASVCPPANHRI